MQTKIMDDTEIRLKGIEAYYGDIWEPDPACYLTDEEIGLLVDEPLTVK